MSVGGVVAVLAVAGLLAGGFGVLGGGPEPTAAPPASTGAAVVPTAVVGPATPSPPTPLVTPFRECGPDPVAPPVISLQTNGVPTRGLVERFDREGELTTAQPSPADPLEMLRGPRVEVQPDVVTELWIDEAACALRWFVVLYDPVTDESYQIDEIPIDAALDPQLAAQNRFGLSEAMATHRDHDNDLQLIGVFEFAGLTVVAWWRIRILPIDVPTPGLRVGFEGPSIPLVPGCDLQLQLANGYQEDLLACQDDLSADPGAARPVRPSDELLLEFGGLSPFGGGVICGRQSGLAFVAVPEPGCSLDVPDGELIPVLDAPGIWVLAISTCADAPGGTAVAFNYVCGTWYAKIKVAAA